MKLRSARAASCRGIAVALGVALALGGPFQPPLPREARAQSRITLFLPMALRGRLPAANDAAPTGTTTPFIAATRTTSPPSAAPPLLSPTPLPTSAGVVTSHPRLWLTAEDLPRLRGWATATNPMFQRGLGAAAQAGRARADAHWSWRWQGGTGRPDDGWQDAGGYEYERDYTESYAQMFAFMSLVDADATAREAWAARARDMLMWIMDQAALGPAPRTPFRDPLFATYNRANSLGMAIPLTVDWIYPWLTTEDKATIRGVFLRWIQDCETAYPISRGPLTEASLVDDPRLLGSSPAQSPAEQAAYQQQLRWTANNYWLGHLRAVTLMSLGFDAADDPDGALAGYARAVTGHWLYAAYAMFEDAGVVERSLGLPPGNRSIGLASGGLPVEGTLYGHSLGFLSQTLLALHTAGYDDPRLAGPQIGLLHSPLWDRLMAGFLHSMSPDSHLPDAASGMSWLGMVYWPATYGDLLRDWVTWEGILTYGPLGVLDGRTGQVERLERIRWILREALQGGPEKLYDRAANIWGNGFVSDSIFYFLNFPPTAPPPGDPRPALPLTFVDRPYGRLLSRSSWGKDATWLTFKCSWMSINHQNGDCNQFELYRKGEWLTKEISGYAEDAILMTSDYHNTLALQNDRPAKPNWFETETIARGGQWTNGAAAGDPRTSFSTGDGYVFAQGDATGVYNHPPDAMDIRHASRSLLWLQPDTVLVYDRADSLTEGRFKRFNLSLVTLPAVDGRKAVETTAGGQLLVIQNLLPQGAVLAARPAERFKTVAQLEPSQARLVVEDPANPREVRFLHLLRAADAGAALPADATLLRADPVTEGGDAAFEGAVVGAEAALFPKDLGGETTSLSFRVPAIVRGFTVTGLAPSATYIVDIRENGGTRTVTVRAGGGGATADEAGVLRF